MGCSFPKETNTTVQEPFEQEINSIKLRLLIDGFIRSKIHKKECPQSIIDLCEKYYPKQLYVMIINERNLKLTLCDISRNDTKLTSNNIIKLNDDDDDKRDDESGDIPRLFHSFVIYNAENL